MYPELLQQEIDVPKLEPLCPRCKYYDLRQEDVILIE